MFRGTPCRINMWSTPAVWKQYNRMAVLHFFLVNSPLIYILYSLWLKTGFTRRACTIKCVRAYDYIKLINPRTGSNNKIISDLLLFPCDSSLNTWPSSCANAEPNFPSPELKRCSCSILAKLESPWNWGPARQPQANKPTCIFKPLEQKKTLE